MDRGRVFPNSFSRYISNLANPNCFRSLDICSVTKFDEMKLETVSSPRILDIVNFVTSDQECTSDEDFRSL